MHKVIRVVAMCAAVIGAVVGAVAIHSYVEGKKSVPEDPHGDVDPSTDFEASW